MWDTYAGKCRKILVIFYSLNSQDFLCLRADQQDPLVLGVPPVLGVLRGLGVHGRRGNLLLPGGLGVQVHLVRPLLSLHQCPEGKGRMKHRIILYFAMYKHKGLTQKG